MLQFHRFVTVDGSVGLTRIVVLGHVLVPSYPQSPQTIASSPILQAIAFIVCCHVYGVTMDEVWSGKWIYWTLCYNS